MLCIQPYSLFIPDYTTVDGWWSGHSSHFFGVLSLYHKTKTVKPGVRIILNCIISLPNWPFGLHLNRNRNWTIILSCPTETHCAAQSQHLPSCCIMNLTRRTWSVRLKVGIGPMLLHGERFSLYLSFILILPQLSSITDQPYIWKACWWVLHRRCDVKNVQQVPWTYHNPFGEKTSLSTLYCAKSDGRHGVSCSLLLQWLFLCVVGWSYLQCHYWCCQCDWALDRQHTARGLCIKNPQNCKLMLSDLLKSCWPHQHQAVPALAGFYVGEQYHAPWAEVDVPQELKGRVFPFVEEALAQVKTSTPMNHGMVNFLELLQQLWPFFWRVSTWIVHLWFPCSHNLKGCSSNSPCIPRVCPAQEAQGLAIYRSDDLL